LAQGERLECGAAMQGAELEQEGELEPVVGCDLDPERAPDWVAVLMS
jgi:hypothetical protein